MRSNCLIWACLLYLRRRRKGDEVYIALRRSRLGMGPHCLLMRRCRDGRFRAVSYKPVDPRERKVPPAVFRGASKWGDL